MSGTVKWYNPKKGYGFITGDDGRDYYISHNDIPETLNGLDKGYTVQFTPNRGNRGYFASDVMLV